MLDLLQKDFKLAIKNIFKKLQGTTSKELNKGRITQIEDLELKITINEIKDSLEGISIFNISFELAEQSVNLKTGQLILQGLKNKRKKE